MTIINSPRVAKFAGFSFVLSPDKYFFNLHLQAILSPFLSDLLDDITKPPVTCQVSVIFPRLMLYVLNGGLIFLNYIGIPVA